ncbi:class I SAM-dependent methyltransferase [Paraflavitalea soli]|uniref:Class I SAM-dependent methyltransferase n=1 Tax=Paraflavitalea soli TaxID=2315862 RepID=A0A3B7MQC7_9BACT|nr:class I SAM-dependent methyltransferase [Paraflavitalea soli]AXY75529.1 class I SAM-dependent methyltransferase [Paraflavitalea soli]
MDSTKRFTNRVEDYVKYRPQYPVELVTYLQEQFALWPGKVIADIGAGTGISTALFLQVAYEVWAVEPNEAMLTKAKELLGHFPAFHPVLATAENTTLQNESIDAIIAGQAFHWFHVEKCKLEFKRILKAKGLVVLMWNERNTRSAFEIDYDALIVKHARDYVKVDHRNIDLEHIAAFFAPWPVQLKIFSNEQRFNFDGLKGRLLSSSYMPAVHDAGYDEMINDLRGLYDQYQQNDVIRISYDTKVYTAKMK